VPSSFGQDFTIIFSPLWRETEPYRAIRCIVIANLYLLRHAKAYSPPTVAALGAQGAVILCVPTLRRKSRDPDVSYVVAPGRGLPPRSPGPLVVLESTTYLGTTEEVPLQGPRSGAWPWARPSTWPPLPSESPRAMPHTGSPSPVPK
jgi:hypothetical protein